MWDDSIPSVDDDEEDQPDSALSVAWTDGQLMRLENEFRKAQRSFAYHPVIGIRPLRGDPPHEYQIDYRVRTLGTNEAGELIYLDEVSMHVWLPPGFPNQPPVVRPMAAVFHPNVAWEGIYLTRPWQPTDTLVNFAARIGELLTYRSYDPESVVNAMAMEWLNQNSGAVPLDTRADFSPFNGGEPLGRIQRLGPGTIEQIRRALDDMRFALVAEDGAPTADEVADFSRQTRSALSLFLDGDVPDNLREQASEFDDWCRELPESAPMWEFLRRQRTRAAAAEHAATGLKSAAHAFDAALNELEQLVPNSAATTPASAVKVIPPMEKLGPMQIKLPPLARDFEKFALESRKLIAAMKSAAPEVPVAPDGSLGRRLAAQAETVKESVNHATRIAESALAEVDALYKRVRPEIQALEQVVGWREYMDMFAKARTLEKQLAEWGAAGVQAFFLENASGSFGPFQFEEPLDIGNSRFVARSAQRGQIEVINPAGQEILARGADGKVTLLVEKHDANPGYQTTFRLTERCDDLVVQIGFIQQQTIEALSQLQRPVAGAASWCGIISALLADAHQQQNLREAHRKATHRWKAVIADLAMLARFKERLATYHLVARMTEEVPRVLALIEKANARHADSTGKIGAIMSKSSRDLETDRLVIPPKLAKAYSEELRARDDAQREVPRLNGLLKQIARELTVRLSSTRLVGRPEVPVLRAIPPVPDELASMGDAMADEPMKQLLAALGTRLGVVLPFNTGVAPAAAHVERPAEPGAKERRPAHAPQSSSGVAPSAPVAPGSPSPTRTTAPPSNSPQPPARVSAPPAPANAHSHAAEPDIATPEFAAEHEQTASQVDDNEAPQEFEPEVEAHVAADHQFDFGGDEPEPQSEEEIIEGFFTDDSAEK